MRTKLGNSPCTRGRAPPFSFCGLCYENLRGRSRHPGHRYCPPPKPTPYIDWSTIMKRPSQVPGSKKGEWKCPDPSFLKDYPTLAAGLCDVWWDDGKPRVPYTLTLRMDEGGVHCCLNDKEASMGLYTTGGTIEDVFELVEACLRTGSASWRRWKK
jgi:hypothetical protein